MTAEADPHEGYTAGPGLARAAARGSRIHGSKAQRGQGAETTAPAPKGDEPMAFARAPRTRGAGGMHARCEAIPPSIHVLASARDTERSAGRRGPRPKEGPQPLPQLPQTADAVPAGCRFKRETSKTVLPFSGFVFGHLPDLTGGFGCRSLSGSKFENRVGFLPGTAGGSERVRRPVMRSFRLPIPSCFLQGPFGLVRMPGGNRRPCVLPGPPRTRTCCGGRRPERVRVTDRRVGGGRNVLSEGGRRRDSRERPAPIQVRLIGGMASGPARGDRWSPGQVRAEPAKSAMYGGDMLRELTPTGSLARHLFHQSRHDDIDRLHAHVVRHRSRLLNCDASGHPPRSSRRVSESLPKPLPVSVNPDTRSYRWNSVYLPEERF